MTIFQWTLLVAALLMNVTGAWATFKDVAIHDHIGMLLSGWLWMVGNAALFFAGFLRGEDFRADNTKETP